MEKENLHIGCPSSNICSLAGHIFDVCSILGVNELHHPNTRNSPFFLLHALSGCPPLSPCAEPHHPPARKHQLTTHEIHTRTHTHRVRMCVNVCNRWVSLFLSCWDWLDKPCLSVVLLLARKSGVCLLFPCCNLEKEGHF